MFSKNSELHSKTKSKSKRATIQNRLSTSFRNTSSHDQHAGSGESSLNKGLNSDSNLRVAQDVRAKTSIPKNSNFKTTDQKYDVRKSLTSSQENLHNIKNRINYTLKEELVVSKDSNDLSQE